jgi:hypothetical protein
MPAAHKRPAARSARIGADVLSARSLNRAWLARQLLLRRVSRPLESVIEHLVALQAQVPATPYYALWSRLSRFKPERLSALLVERQCVRGTSLRATLHLSTTRDFARLRPLLRPVFERALHTSSPYGRRLGSVQVERVIETGRALLREPCTLSDLRRELATVFPGHDAEALAYAVHYSVAMVQLPPRGLWRESGRAVCADFEAATGSALAAPGEDVETLVLRYLGAYGPTSARDAQVWSGLTRFGEVFERLRPKLRTFRSEQGAELFDLPNGKRPSPEVPAPVRFLPEYDNALLGLADRSRFLDPQARAYPAQGNESFGTLLIDGYLRGLWKLKPDKREAPQLRIHLLTSVTAAQRRELEEEGARLLAFTGVEDTGAIAVVKRL